MLVGVKYRPDEYYGISDAVKRNVQLRGLRLPPEERCSFVRRAYVTRYIFQERHKQR